MTVSRGRFLGRLVLVGGAIAIGWGFLHFPDTPKAVFFALLVLTFGGLLYSFIGLATGPSLMDVLSAGAQTLLDVNAEQANHARDMLVLSHAGSSGWLKVDRGGLLLHYRPTAAGVEFAWAHDWPQGTLVIGSRIDASQETQLFSRTDRRGRFVDADVKPRQSYTYHIDLSLSDDPVVSELLGSNVASKLLGRKVESLKTLGRQRVFDERITIPQEGVGEQGRQDQEVKRVRATEELKARIRTETETIRRNARLESERAKAEFKAKVAEDGERLGLSQEQIAKLIEEVEIED